MKDYTKLEEIKQDYDTISFPKDLEERVKRGILQAKEDTKKQKSFYQKPIFWIKFGGCAVASMAVFTLIINLNTPLAKAMSNIPVLSSIVKVVSIPIFEDATGDMIAEVTVPQVEVEDTSGQKNEEASKELNARIKSYTDKIIRQYQEDVAESKGKAKEEVLTDYEVITDSSRLFSLKINTTTTAGSSDYTVKIYHLDKSTGKIITLNDIFQKNTNYLNVLTKEIKRQMREQMAEDDQKIYFIDDTDMPEDNWKGLTADSTFYKNDNGELTFVFDKYTVAPGYMGSCEFSIPAEVIEDMINPDYLCE